MTTTYRITVQLPSRDLAPGAPFAHFGDANEWAMGYARGKCQPCKVKVLNSSGIVCACYLGDGNGRARCASDEIGEVLS